MALGFRGEMRAGMREGVAHLVQTVGIVYRVARDLLNVPAYPSWNDDTRQGHGTRDEERHERGGIHYTPRHDEKEADIDVAIFAFSDSMLAI